MAFNASLVTADAFIITPSTNGATKFTAYGFYVGGTNGQAKNVNVITGRSNTVLFQGVSVGTVIPLVICAVRTTNTTSSAQLIGFGPS